MSPTYNDPGALAGAIGAGIVVAEGQQHPNNTSPASSRAWRHLVTVHPAADLFPMGSDAELGELARDIETNGLRSPLSLWRSLPEAEWQLLDGRNRVAAMASLVDGQDMVKGAIGAANQYEALVDPVAFVISANIHRRHLDQEKRKNLIDELLKMNPARSDRQIAAITKSSPTTVGTRRAGLEKAGEVSKLDTRTGADGVAQPAHKQSSFYGRTIKAMRDQKAKAGPAPSPSLKRDTTIGHICAWLRADVKDALDDLVHILRDEQNRIATLPIDRRIIAARGLLQALGVTADDLKRGAP